MSSFVTSRPVVVLVVSCALHLLVLIPFCFAAGAASPDNLGPRGAGDAVSLAGRHPHRCRTTMGMLTIVGGRAVTTATAVTERRGVSDLDEVFSPEGVMEGLVVDGVHSAPSPSPKEEDVLMDTTTAVAVTSSNLPSWKTCRVGGGGVAAFRRHSLTANRLRRPNFVVVGRGGDVGRSTGGDVSTPCATDNDGSGRSNTGEREEESPNVTSYDGGATSTEVRTVFDNPGDDDDSNSGDCSDDDEGEIEVEGVSKEDEDVDQTFDVPVDDNDDGSGGDYSDEDDAEDEAQGVQVSEEEDLTLRIESTVRETTREAEAGLAALSAKQDGAALAGQMPILEFGSDADAILQRVEDRFRELVVEEEAREGQQQQASSSSAMDLIRARRTEVLRFVAGDAGGMKRLYNRQLDALREHYGRRYEDAMEGIIAEEEEVGGGGGGEGGDEWSKERRGGLIAAEASRATEGFRSAAQNAIPRLCREGQELRDVDGGYEYSTTMAGLINDLMEATTLVEGAEADWASAASLEVSDSDSDEDADDGQGAGGVGRKCRKPMKWYHKLGARLVVLGINYLQGVLALQGLKKAAADRDKNMPKFPLF